tara:strand:+ start:448 stop:594 length:147 start_codon:yes stop_codon:yes gene_type:complete
VFGIFLEFTVIDLFIQFYKYFKFEIFISSAVVGGVIVKAGLTPNNTVN